MADFDLTFMGAVFEMAGPAKDSDQGIEIDISERRIMRLSISQYLEDCDEHDPAPTPHLRSEAAWPTAEKSSSRTQENSRGHAVQQVADVDVEKGPLVSKSAMETIATVDLKASASSNVLDENHLGKSAGKKSLFHRIWSVADRSSLNTQMRSEAVNSLFTMRHPHVVTLMGMTTAPDHSLCLVMERLDQGSLHDILCNPMMFLEIPVTFGMMRNIVQGMSYMHLAQPPIVHRLLKSSNVVVDSKFTAKISDFGIADLAGDVAFNNEKGCAFWIAPEVLSGQPYSCASDVYAFGITMYELWTRLEPYKGEDQDAVVRDVARPPPTAMRMIWKRPVLPEGHDVPAPVVDLMERCWHQDPKQRPTFREISSSLDEMEVDVVRQKPKHDFGKDQRLLEQILPPHVAALLRDGKEVPPESHPMVTLLFTDIVGFTDISSSLEPKQVEDG